MVPKENDEVFMGAGAKRKFLHDVNIRQIRFEGNVRREKLENLPLTTMMVNKIPRKERDKERLFI